MSLTVSAEKVASDFPHFQQAALREPVIVTEHGRESVVIVDAAEYRRLKSRDRVALAPHELSAEDVAAIEAAEPPPESYKYEDETRR